jgi:hypothetical protein
MAATDTRSDLQREFTQLSEQRERLIRRKVTLRRWLRVFHR